MLLCVNNSVASQLQNATGPKAKTLSSEAGRGRICNYCFTNERLRLISCDQWKITAGKHQGKGWTTISASCLLATEECVSLSSAWGSNALVTAVPSACCSPQRDGLRPGCWRCGLRWETVTWNDLFKEAKEEYCMRWRLHKIQVRLISAVPCGPAQSARSEHLKWAG